MKKLLFSCILVLYSCFAFAQDNSPSINHVAICVHDLKKSTAFYTDVVQLKTIPHPFKDTIHTWFSMGGGVQLHVIQANCPPVEHNINIHLCFKVLSLTDFMKHLDAYNIQYGNWAGDYKKTQTRPDGVVQIYFQDPDGYWIEINNSK